MSNLVAYGIKQCEPDPCIFRLTSLDGKEVGLVMGLYVEDIIVTHETSCCRELRTFL